MRKRINSRHQIRVKLRPQANNRQSVLCQARVKHFFVWIPNDWYPSSPARSLLTLQLSIETLMHFEFNNMTHNSSNYFDFL